ncbi:uncharacterized protein [Diadema antillarum]|uniref:uncharacterized protein n=1 Tax=Diadema antillarum TaxID=105358 RepID=UPI003A88FE1B
MPRYMKPCDPIDDFLASQGLMRKLTAKDGSCLFRAVAEQVFHTQALHNTVRQACIRYMERNRAHFEPFVEGSFDEHLQKLRNAKEWAGQVEISALSLMYKRDFIIYQDMGKPPSNVTQNGFPDVVLLCFTNNNHYDSVFSKSYHSGLAVCQSIVYEILYKRVFNIAKEADEAVEILRSSPSKKTPRPYGFRERNNNTDGLDRDQHSPRRQGDDERDRFGKPRIEKRRPPLPYKVAKALDPDLYRNVEYDCWNEANKQQLHQDYIMASGLQFCPGDKVQVCLDDHRKWYNAHIQEVKPDQGPFTVFIEDLGEKHEVPLKNVKPHPLNPPRPWTVVGGRGYKNMAYHQKCANGGANGVDFRNRGRPPAKWGRGQGMMMVSQSYPPGGDVMSDQHIHSQPDKAFRGPSPFRVMEGHAEHIGRGRLPNYPSNQVMQGHPFRGGRTGRMYNQPGPGGCYEVEHPSDDLDDRKTFEDTFALYELRDQSFPSLSPINCVPQGTPGTQQPQFWNKLRKDGRRSISPQQRVDTPSPHLSDKRGSDQMESVLSGQFSDMMIANQEQVGNESPCIDRQYSPMPQMSDDGMMQPSPLSMPKSATPSSLSVSPGMDPQASSPPNIAPAGYVPPFATMGLPFYHFFIPMNDWNLTGPVNWHALISKDPNGADLPMTDICTLRFFYNLGLEYHRRLCLLQHIQQHCYHYQAAAGPMQHHHQMHPQQQQQQHQQHHPQQHPGLVGGYSPGIPQHNGMGMPAQAMMKSPYDMPEGAVALPSPAANGQEDSDPSDGQIAYNGSGSGRNSVTPGYMSAEPVSLNPAGMPPSTNPTYSLPIHAGPAGDTYVPMTYHQGMPHPVSFPVSPAPNPNVYMYQQQLAGSLGYPGGKVQASVPHSTYSGAPVAHAHMTSQAACQQQQQQQQHHQPQGYMTPSNSGSVVATPSSGVQYGTHSTSIVSNSSCSSQDSGVLSSSPTQVPYTSSG